MTTAIEYLFLFDASETWQHAHQFDRELADFFASKNLELEILNPKDAGRKILMIKRLQGIGVPEENKESTPVRTPREQVNSLAKILGKGNKKLNR